MYRQRPPRLSHLRAFGCDCTHWCKKSMSKGTGWAGIFLGYTPKSPSGTYRIGVKGKRTGTMVDSRHVIFDEHQVLPKFLDKTKHSHIPDDVNNLLKEAPKHKSAKRVTFALQGGKPNDVVNQDGNFSTEGGRKSKRVFGNPKTMIWQKSDDQPRTELKQSACTDKDKIKINDIPKRKYRVQDLVGDDRVLAPGKNFHPKKGNRAKYIADRLQSLIGLTPDESIKLR